MRPFRCPVTIINTIDHLDKFDGKADEGFFVGYSLNSKAFRVFNSRTRIVEENLHIRFSESTPNAVGSGQDWLFDIDALTRTMNYEPIVAGIQPNGFADPKSSHDDGSKPSSDDEKVDKDPRKDSGCNNQEKEDNVNSTNNVNAAGTNEVNVVGGKTSIELPFDPNMPALEDYSIFDLSRDDEDDNAEYRIVDELYQHRQKLESIFGTCINIRKRELVSSVARIEAIRLFLAYASFKDFVVYQMDVKSDFLYGKIEEEVYVCQPPGFEDPDFPDRVYKVEKALYGLHQAPRAWYETLSTYLLDNGFQRGKIDKTLFIKRHKGLQVKQKKDGIFICQDKYVKEILKKFRFTEVKTASTPMETKKPLLKDEDGEEVDVHMYRYQFPKDSPFDLVAYTDSDYAGVSLDMKSTIGGCQFLRCKLISWQCKKQIVVANSTTEVEYMAALSCRGQVLWNEVIYKELGNSLVRAATTASSLEAEQDSGNITKTRSKETPNESSSLGTTSGGGPRCQETIRDTTA
ncbi:retrovirus-related pol polyprotein from transposon TNT 1-94 [Tanacetum coccineum]